MHYRIQMHKLAAVITVVLALAAAPGFGQFMFSNMMQDPGAANQVDSPKVDWNQEFIYAVGKGVISSDESNASKAYQKAQGEGKMKAVASLLNLLETTPVNYKSTGSDYIGKDRSLGSRIEERLTGVEVVGEKQLTESGETVLQVTVRVPMYGSNGVGSAVLQSVFQREIASMGVPAGLSIDKKGDTSAPTTSESGPFTSLIVDCSGLEIDRALNPKLRKADGSEFWGTPGMGTGFLQDHGAVSYAASLQDAKSLSLAGSSPLVIKAVGRAGSRFMCDPIISDADAELAANANRTSQFLDKCDVIFIVDTD